MSVVVGSDELMKLFPINKLLHREEEIPVCGYADVGSLIQYYIFLV